MRESDFMTIAEASRKLGVAPNTLRSWGGTGKIQEYRHPLNNYRLYRQEDVNALAKVLQSPVKVRRPAASDNVSQSSI